MNQSQCGTSIGNNRVTELVLATGAVIFVECLEILVLAVQALPEEAQPSELKVSRTKTEVHAF